MESLPTLAEIDDEIMQSMRIFREQLGIECTLASEAFMKMVQTLNICSFVLPPAIRYGSFPAASGASPTHTKPVHCELERRCRRLAMGRYVHPREAA
jgi:hypothetical protein